jgi:hypothetical protein
MGCGEYPEIEWETDHLRVGSEVPLCQGTITDLDAHVRRVETLLEAEMDAPVDVFIFEELPSWACSGQRAAGCWEPWANRVVTDLGARDHELVHAVAHSAGNGRADELFAEGLAHALYGYRNEFGWQPPSAGIGTDAEGLDYFSAGHFMRWLYEDKGGAPPMKQLLDGSSEYRGPDFNRRAFEDAYGISFDEAEAEYFAFAPEMYAGVAVCDLAEIDVDARGMVDTDIGFDCSAEHTGGSDIMTRSFVWKVEEAGDYTVEVEKPAAIKIDYCDPPVVERGERRPFEPGRPVGETPLGRPNWVPSQYLYRIDTVHLEASTVRIRVEAPVEFDLTTVGLRIHPSTMPAPQGG